MGALNSHADRQVKSTGVQHSQREIPIFSSVENPAEVEQRLVESCKDELMALNRCIDLSGLTDDTLSGALGIDPGHFSRIRRGRAHFPAKKRLRLMSLCGNLLPLQFEAWKSGYQLVPISKDEQIRRLERELAALRRVA